MITPRLEFCPATISECCSRVSSIVSGANKLWTPQLSGVMPPQVLQLIRENTSHACCRSVEDAEHLVAAGFQTIVVTRPVVDVNSLVRLATLAARAHVSVVVDHFRQAELLSNSMLSAGASAEVLIGVDLGRQGSGIRPGPDSVLLAAATAKLPAVHLRGLYVDDSGCRRSQDKASGSLSFDEAIGVALHCQRMIEAEKISCRDIVTGFSHLAESVAHRSVTSVLTSPCHSVAMLPDKTDATPAAALVCRVLSRPSLEWCVVDAGASMICDPVRTTVLQPSGARILHLHSDTTTLALAGESLDLRIGAEVVLSIDGFERNQRLPIMIIDSQH